MIDGPPVVALDTNALMMPVELNVRTFEELERLVGAAELVVPQAVLDELERLRDEGTPDEAAAARVGYELATERCRAIGGDSRGADRVLADLAGGEAVDYVVTNDAPLRRRILDAGVPVISLRGRTKLTIIQP